MNGILVFGNGAGGALDPASWGLGNLADELARKLGGAPVAGALVGSDVSAAAAIWAAGGPDRIMLIEHPSLAAYTSEAYIAAAQAIIGAVQPRLVIFPHSTDTSEWVPRLAAGLGCGLVTACSGLSAENARLLAVKPVCGGCIEASYAIEGELQMVTFAGSLPEGRRQAPPGEVVSLALPLFTPRVEWLADMANDADDGPKLKDARIVVAGGLGIGDSGNWLLVEAAASALHAAVGASRAAVEMGWAPSARQVGFSGAKIAPELYVAIGISGAQHHMAGLARAKTIVAINSDPNAVIFRHAHFGVVGDARLVVPAFLQRLTELRKQG
ncbi:electron transfer flavoprotein alpha subunit [Angulomicrobium tetraedrale]|uniref:Electron transfer flavoprotein alpha subunit n=1 Tax=Ancylobacter tetraedralis TaxID=217068 RepID=A0A839ZF20_9HYPH|nr:electron transfer flavoprotein subunit alpha/FixB family protein [Ancylobacter tetraedralis]MBB3773431.1 electron transfer flavoprotein alpha subunit [Ancylobacter tetraedralis]